MVELHVGRPLRLIRRLHLNRRIHLALQLRGAAEVAHGAAAEFASRRRYELLLVVVMLQVILHATASKAATILHFVASLRTLEALNVEFLLNEILYLILLLLIIVNLI